MKWTNKGHEFDELAQQYLQYKKLFIWGAGRNGKKCIEFLRWLKIDSEFEIYMVDSDVSKQGTECCGLKVGSPDELFASYDNLSIVASSNKKISEILEKRDIPYFSLTNEHSGTHNFIQNFICIYMFYKHNKLVSHWMNFVTTTRCNLSCKGCAIFSEYNVSQKDVSFDEFKKHIDIVFSKYDLMYSFHLSGGEPFLHKDLAKFVEYINETYGDRIFDLFIITNGIIMPNNDVLTTLKKRNWWAQVDDYTDVSAAARKNSPLVTQKLNDWDIEIQYIKADHWYDLTSCDTDHSDLTEDELTEWRKNCNLYLQAVQNGKIYSCCYVEYAREAGVEDEAANESLDISKASKAELLEFRMGYTTKGYVEYCKRCNGIGKNAKRIPVGVQAFKQNV